MRKRGEAPRLAWAGRTHAPRPPEARLDEVSDGSADLWLVAGDNLAALGALAQSHARAVHLAYLDPPFFTGRTHRELGPKRRGTAVGAVAFEDRWSDFPSYLAALEARLRALRPLLAPEGSIVIHVDSRTSHYVRVLADEVFGLDAFQSEIVWRYRRWPSRTPNFQRVHDTLLRYVGDPSVAPRFNQLYEPLAASTRKTWGDKKQEAVMGEDGRRRRSSVTEQTSPGTPLGDVWEIGIIAPIARERTGFPTQKPEALLRRLVESCTNAGELVLDPYAGSGTTLAVCQAMGRRAIGLDDSPAALETTARRLTALGAAPKRFEARTAAKAEVERATE